MGRARWTLPALIAIAVTAVTACGSDEPSQGRHAFSSSATTTASPQPSRSMTGSPGHSATTPRATLTAGSTRTMSSNPSDGRSASSGEIFTLADSGKKVSLAIGESVSIRLPGPWPWRGPVVDGDAVIVAPIDFLIDPGYSQWAVQGVRAGSARVRINGNVNCPPGAVCVGPKTFVLTFEVS